MAVNLNDVARRITIAEGGIITSGIGQAKEFMKLMIDDMTAEYTLYEIVMMLRKHGQIDGLDTKAERENFKKFLEERYIC